MYAALRFKVNGDYDIALYPVGKYNEVDWEQELPSELGEDYWCYNFESQQKNRVGIDIVNGLDGKPILRVMETIRYMIKLEVTGKSPVSLPILQNENNKSLRIDKDKNSVTFQFINYLGRTKVSFKDGNSYRELRFEVVPNKMDYEDDYITLTESLAERCSELLLEYSGSTSNLFEQSEEDGKTLLEQFIFLRTFCFRKNLLGIFEAIKRNPDRILIENLKFKQVGCGVPSRKIFTSLFSYTKKWGQYESDGRGRYYMPSEIAVNRKRDTVDTVANRFLKFALEKFRNICEELLCLLNKEGSQKQMECWKEASIILGMIDDILCDSFFDEVGVLGIMPQNNQVLQKREGYSDIFLAYSMVDLALQLDWRGMNSVYEGESKNVALLYEYWLFFELVNVIQSIEGCDVIPSVETEEAWIAENGRLHIFLKEGKKSCKAFRLNKVGMKINLYYNRSFFPADFYTTKYEGSYSRPFRPDYTLAIFPNVDNEEKENDENKAMRDGTVSYVHFDAKYRISNLTSFLKEGGTEESYEREVEEEKEEEISNTYKRGDLLKMHTYNDAIRRTIGSYVLYPGDIKMGDLRATTFCLYDEILPGVGAFAIKPSIRKQGEHVLRDFITKLVEEKNQRHSRLNRLNYYTEIVLQEPAASKRETNKGKWQLNSLCVIGYIRADKEEDYYYSLVKNGLLEKDKEFLFYYYAIKGNAVYSHHKDIAKAGKFRFYKNNIIEAGVYELEPILCEIQSNELVSKEDLVKRLNKQGYFTTNLEHGADYYYVLKVRVEQDGVDRAHLKMEKVNKENGNDSFSPHSPKVIEEGKVALLS